MAFFLHWKESLGRSYLRFYGLGEGKGREGVPKLNCRILEESLTYHNDPFRTQLMTKDTPDSLSPENYENFDTQVMILKHGKGFVPNSGSLGC